MTTLLGFAALNPTYARPSSFILLIDNSEVPWQGFIA